MATSKIIELDDSNTCKVCDNALAKYSCPRCNILYCSLACYQSASHIQCSESFYKDCVTEDLSLGSSDDKTKVKISEILRRVHLDDAEKENKENICEGDECACCDECVELTSDEEEYENLVDRFSNVDLDKQSAEEIWDKLNKDEQQEFLAFLRSGDVSKLVPAWKPWWTLHDDSKIEEVGNEKNKKYKENCPKYVKIKDFSSLSAKHPADCVKYNLMNILASYALTARYFNGEHQDFDKEAVSCVITNSVCLKSNENFEDFDTVVKSVEQECLNCDWITLDHENMIKMKEDLYHILKGPNKSDKKYYIISALSDLYRLIKEALRKKENEDSANSFSKKLPPDEIPKIKLESEEKMKQVLKKVEYYLSYARDCFSYD